MVASPTGKMANLIDRQYFRLYSITLSFNGKYSGLLLELSLQLGVSTPTETAFFPPTYVTLQKLGGLLFKKWQSMMAKSFLLPTQHYIA